MENELMRMEVQQAVTAGEQALESLENAALKLKSASNWGFVDMIGGGFFASLVKHSKMNDATGYMEDARYRLQVFQKELRDVHLPSQFQLEVGTFLTFADFFFDDIISDYLVQSRIAETREQLNEAIRQVKQILNDLYNLLNSREG